MSVSLLVRCSKLQLLPTVLQASTSYLPLQWLKNWSISASSWLILAILPLHRLLSSPIMKRVSPSQRARKAWLAAVSVDLRFHSVHEGHAAGHLKLCSLSKVNATDILTKASTHPDVFSDLGRSISCLQHYANTATSKMQATNEEAKGNQSWKTNSAVEWNIVRWNRRLDWNAWLLQTSLSSMVSNKKLENAHLFCLNMLEIWIQTNLWSQMILKDPAVFQPFRRVYNVALREMANTVAAVMVHTQTQYLFESNILIWK